MSAGDVPRLFFVAALAAVVTLVSARLARHVGLVDGAQGDEAARKRQRRPVPCVGGLVLLVALGAAPVLPWDPSSCPGLARFWPEPGWVLSSLLAVTALGAFDDRRPLGPLAKGSLSLVAFLPIGVGLLRAAPQSESWPVALGFVLGGCTLAHVLNTYDNADGALPALALLGFLFPIPWVSAACAGFLPFNLDAGRPANRSARAPTAYLGDGGSFALGFLVACTPAVWGLACLPVLDLGRLSIERFARGSRPWIGDRRHLAHRLEACGLGRPAVALLLTGIAAPSTLGAPQALMHGRLGLFALALGATLVLFLAAVRWSRARA